MQLQTGSNLHNLPEGEAFLPLWAQPQGRACLGSHSGWEQDVCLLRELVQVHKAQAWPGAPAQLTLLSPLQMADSGGLPQVTQVRLLILPPLPAWVGGKLLPPENTGT